MLAAGALRHGLRSGTAMTRLGLASGPSGLSAPVGRQRTGAGALAPTSSAHLPVRRAPRRLSRSAQIRHRDGTTRGAPGQRDDHGALQVRKRPGSWRAPPVGQRSATDRAAIVIISAARCTGGKGHRIPAPRASVQREGRKERCSRSARSRLVPVPAFAGQASRPVRRGGWIRTGVRFAGCGTLLLYRGPKPWDRTFDFMALPGSGLHVWV
jgi:hypothetical protein